MKHLVGLIGVLLSAVAGALAALPVYVMGLVVPMVVVWPLKLGATALIAAIVAGLFANLANRDGRHTRLLAVVCVAEGAATVLALLSSLTYLAPDAVPMWPAVYSIFAASAVLALVATVGASRWRSGGGTWKKDVLTALVLILIAPLLVYGGIVAACATPLGCGA